MKRSKVYPVKFSESEYKEISDTATAVFLPIGSLIRAGAMHYSRLLRFIDAKDVQALIDNQELRKDLDTFEAEKKTGGR